MGSIPPAASIEYPQREIANLITGTGVVASNANLNQLAQAIQSGQLFYGLDTGSANHMVCALTPTPAGLRRGMHVVIYAADNNTGATDLTTNGVSTAVVRPDGTPLTPGDIKQFGMMLMVYDGLRWQLISAGGASALRILVQPLDLYVNGAIGNDANDGTANNAAHALQTVQRGINIAQTYNPSAYGVNIHIADGVYNEAAQTSMIATPTINIIGNVLNPDNVVVGQAGPMTYPKLVGIGVQGPNSMTIEGVCGRTGSFPTDNPNCFGSWYGSQLTLKNTSSLYSQGPCIEAYGAAAINIEGNHKFGAHTGGGGGINAWQAGIIYVTGQVPIQFNIDPGVSWSSTVYAIDGGSIVFQGHVATWGGSIPTGPRYQAHMNGSINTMGGGATYIPGTIAGSVVTGGQYQ